MLITDITVDWMEKYANHPVWEIHTTEEELDRLITSTSMKYEQRDGCYYEPILPDGMPKYNTGKYDCWRPHWPEPTPGTTELSWRAYPEHYIPQEPKSPRVKSSQVK